MLLPLLAAAQAPLYWSPTFEVAPSNFHNLRPQIALVQGETPLVIWGSTIGGRKGWVARWNGGGFDTPMRANPNGSINAYTVEGPNIAAQGDTAYLVYTTAPTNNAKAMLRASTDGGQTWDLPRWIDSLGTDLPTFPNIAIGAGGQAIAMYMRQQSNHENPRFIVRTSTDAGQTWNTDANASSAAAGGEVCDCCTGHVYALPDRIIALFRNNDNNLRDIWMTQSFDGGASFTVGADLDSTDWNLAACPSSGPEAHMQGDSIFTAFMSAAGQGQRIYLSAAHIDSLTVAYNRELEPGIGQNAGQNYPAVAGRGDTIGVVWAYDDGNIATIRMNYSFSGPQGLFGQAPFDVASSVVGSHNYPDISFENGTFHIVWANQSNSRVMYRRLSVDSFVVGLPTVQTRAMVRIVPNPASEEARLEWQLNVQEMGQIQISNVVGKLVYEKEVQQKGEIRMDVRAWTPGLYFVSLKSPSGGQKTLRFVVN